MSYQRRTQFIALLRRKVQIWSQGTESFYLELDCKNHVKTTLETLQNYIKTALEQR